MYANAKIQIIKPHLDDPTINKAYDVNIKDGFIISEDLLRIAGSVTIYDDLAESIVEYNNDEALIGYSAQTGELEIPQKEILQISVRIATSGDNQRIFWFKDVPIWTDPNDTQSKIIGNITSTGFEFAERGGAYFTRQFMMDHGLQEESDLNISIFAATAVFAAPGE